MVDNSDVDAEAESVPSANHHRVVRLRLDERGTTLRATFVDPDPADALPIGVFAGSTGAYADFLAANPSVAAVAEPAAAEPAIDWIVLRPDRAGEPSGEGFAFR